MSGIKNNEIKKISEGAYGCVFRPGFKCDGEIMNTDEYITKVQRKKRFSRHETKTITEKEIEIGIKVKNIPNYDDFFAPLLSSCPINISIMSNQGELKKCELIDRELTSNRIPEFDSSKIKYVGKYSLADYLLNKRVVLLKTFIEKHKDILASLQKLFEGGIIHFDLKENNIICKDKTGAPIIIDFGLSIDIAELEIYKLENLGKFFYVYAPDYGPWCIDICVLSYIANSLDAQALLLPITEDNLTKIIVEYINENAAIIELLDDVEKTQLKNDLLVYFKTFVTKTWKELADDLIKYKGSWDNYSATIIYLYLFKDLSLEVYETRFAPFAEYKKLMKSVLLSKPNERKSAKEMKDGLTGIFTTIRTEDLNRIRLELRTEMGKRDHIKKIKRQIGKAKTSSLLQKEALMNRMLQ